MRFSGLAKRGRECNDRQGQLEKKGYWKSKIKEKESRQSSIPIGQLPGLQEKTLVISRRSSQRRKLLPGRTVILYSEHGFATSPIALSGHSLYSEHCFTTRKLNAKEAISNISPFLAWLESYWSYRLVLDRLARLEEKFIEKSRTDLLQKCKGKESSKTRSQLTFLAQLFRFLLLRGRIRKSNTYVGDLSRLYARNFLKDHASQSNTGPRLGSLG